MAAVWQQFWFYHLYQITKKVNGLLYFLRKIPVVGRLISPTFYRYYEIKKLLLIVYFMLQTLSAVLVKFIWLGAYYYLAYLILAKGHPEVILWEFQPAVMSFGLLLWGIVVSLWMYNITSIFSKGDPNQQAFISAFQISRQVFLRRLLFVEVLQQVVYYLPAFIVYAFLGRNWLLFLVCPFLYSSGFFLGGWLSRWSYQKQWRSWMKWVYAVLMLLAGVGIGGGFLWLKGSVTLQLLVMLVVAIALTVFSIYQILHFTDEAAYYLNLNQSLLEQTSKLADAKKKDVEFVKTGLAMQKELTLTTHQDVSHLKGSAYLNALLFDRYRKILNRKLRIRLIVLGIVAVGMMLLGVFGLTQQLKQSELIRVLPVLFFVMYFASMGKTIVQMVFVNCDVAMLYYPFYRESQTIISGFNYRLLRILGYNSIIAMAIFAIFGVLNLFGGFILNQEFFLVLVLLLIALTALFSFHELFIYYILQPFTGDMQVVSPLYRIVSVALYWLSYLNSQLKTAGMTYVIAISIACILYVLVGYLIIRRKAPKTFRIKT